MATFPGGIFAPTNPTATDTMDGANGGAAVYHDEQHTNVNNEIVAIETALLNGAYVPALAAPVGDATPTIQAAYDAGGRLLILGPGTWTVETPFFHDSTSMEDPLTIQLSDAATILLTSSLPTMVLAALPAVTGITSGAGSFTITFGTAHGISAGSAFSLSGFTPSGYNGNWVAASVSSTQITVTSAANPGTSTVQGTATGAAFSPDAATVCWAFPGTLRSAYNAGTNTVEVVNGGTNNTSSFTGASGEALSYYPKLIIRGGILNGGGIDSMFAFGNGAACWFDSNIAIDWTFGFSWAGYTDGNKASDGNIAVPSAASATIAQSVFCYQITNGDAVQMDHMKANGDCAVWIANACSGGTVRDGIGGQYWFTNCTGIKVISGHIECNEIDIPSPAFKISQSRIDIDSHFWEAGNATLPNVTGITSFTTYFQVQFATAHNLAPGSVITLSGFTPSGYNGTWTVESNVGGTAVTVSSLLNPGTSSVQGTAVSDSYWLEINDAASPATGYSQVTVRASSGIFVPSSDRTRAPDIYIAAMNNGSSLTVENTTAVILKPNVENLSPDSLIVTSAVGAITTALSNATYTAFQKAITAAPRWCLHQQGGSGTWVVDGGTAAASLQSIPGQSTISLTATASSFGPGTLTNGTAYYYAMATMDDDAVIAAVSASATATATSQGAISLTADIKGAPTSVIIWRCATNAVLSAPTAYCIIPVTTPEVLLIDLGANVNGRPWVTTSVPVPNSLSIPTTSPNRSLSFGGPGALLTGTYQAVNAGGTVTVTQAGVYEIGVVGAGGGGGGGGAGASNLGGGGGGVGAAVIGYFTLTAGEVLTFSIGNGGGGGAATATGTQGAQSSVSGTGVSLVAAGGGPGGGSANANTATSANGGIQGANTRSATTFPGTGGFSASVSGSAVPFVPGGTGGGGGGTAQATTNSGSGGAAGAAGSATAAAGTTGGTSGLTGGVGNSAAANTGAGGGGGGGGTASGTGGAGGTGGSGFGWVRQVG